VESRLLPIATLLSAIAFVTPSLAAPPTCESSEFQAFRTEFMDAANANDKTRLAKLIAFPVEYWSTEIKGNVQTTPIKSEAEFLQQYDTLFTGFMRKKLRTAKLESGSDGRCALMWHDANSESAFEFDYVPGTGFRLTSYDVGAY
jgi:hypothetical protein